MATKRKRGWYVNYLPALISFPLFVLVTFLNEYQISLNAQQSAKQVLEYQSKTLIEALDYLKNDQPNRPLDYDKVIDALSRNTENRISIISSAGQLLGDSHLSSSALTASSDLLSKPELKFAKENLRGYSLRFDPVTSTTLRFLALNQGDYLFRIGRDYRLEQQAVVEQRYNYLPVYLLLFLATSIGGYFFVSWINLQLTRRYQRLKEKIQKQTTELLLLQEFGTLLTLSKSIADIEQVLGKFAQMLLYHDAGVISIIRSSRNIAEIKIKWGLDSFFATPHYPLDACWALRKGYVHPQGPYDKLIRCDHDEVEQSNIICIPLVSQGETLGVMHISRESTMDEFDDNDRKIATSLAEQVALSVANLQLRENLRDQAIKDSLTGLYNRRYFSETIEKEIARAQKMKMPLALLILDIDHFKKLNDSFGHDAGDAALREFGILLNDIVTAENIACRIGGEEFVLMLTDTDEQQAIEFSHHLLANIRQLKIINNGTSIGQITASIGVALSPKDSTQADVLVSLADKALYQAKNNGRNQAVFYHDMTSSTITD